jgi:hypothetical protein
MFRDVPPCPAQSSSSESRNDVFVAASCGTWHECLRAGKKGGMKPTDDHARFQPSAEFRAKFKEQATGDMMKRLKAFTISYLAGFGRGAPVDIDYAEDLAAAAAHDTACGRITWNLDTPLEKHLRIVIVRRVKLDYKRAKKFRHESLDASMEDDASSTTLNDMERVLAERYPDPEATANAAEAFQELQERARSDPELAAYIELREDADLTGHALEAATGLSPEAIRRVRRRLDAIRPQLSYQIRPTRRKRGH